MIGISATAGLYPSDATGPSIALQVTDTTVFKYIDGGLPSAIGTGGGTTNDVFALEVDFDTDTVTLYKNGSSFATVVTGHLSTDDTWFVEVGYSGSATYPIVTYENSPDVWSYSPSSSAFKANCTANIPTVTGQLSDHFVASPRAGNNSASTAVDVNGPDGSKWDKQIDLLISKSSNNSVSWLTQDTLRGAGNNLFIDDTAAQTTTSYVSALGVGEFTIGSNIGYNTSGWNYIDYALNLPDSETNSSGDISVDWKYNATLGVAIGTYTGTGTAGHTLGIPSAFGKAPFMHIVKRYDSTGTWVVYHRGVAPDAETDYLILNTTAAAVDTVIAWNDTAPTSSVITLGSDTSTNASGADFYILVFFETAFCRSCAFEGTGNADGPFVYLGGLPYWSMMKNADFGSSSWVIYDAERDPTNAVDSVLFADNSGAEVTGNNQHDWCATGNKVRNSQQSTNLSGDTIIGVAFVEPLGVEGPAQRRPR